MPQTDAVKLEQLDTYLRIGPPLMSSKAFTSPAVEASYLKARQLCDDVGTDAQLLTVLWGLWLHYAHRGRIDESRPLAQKIVAIAANGICKQLLMWQQPGYTTRSSMHRTSFSMAVTTRVFARLARRPSPPGFWAGHRNALS